MITFAIKLGILVMSTRDE